MCQEERSQGAESPNPEDCPSAVHHDHNSAGDDKTVSGSATAAPATAGYPSAEPLRAGRTSPRSPRTLEFEQKQQSASATVRDVGCDTPSLRPTQWRPPAPASVMAQRGVLGSCSDLATYHYHQVGHDFTTILRSLDLQCFSKDTLLILPST